MNRVIAAIQRLRHPPVLQPGESTVTEDTRELERRNRELEETVAYIQAQVASMTHRRPEGR